MKRYDMTKIESLVLEGFGLSSEKGPKGLIVTDPMKIPLPIEYKDKSTTKYIVPTGEGLKIIFSNGDMSIKRDKVKEEDDTPKTVLEEPKLILNGEPIIDVKPESNNSVFIKVYYDEFHGYKIIFTRSSEKGPAKIEIEYGAIMTLTYDNEKGVYCEHSYGVVDKMNKEDCTVENCVRLIYQWIKDHIDGKFWNEKLMMGLARVGVALGYCTKKFIDDMTVDMKDQIQNEKRDPKL